MQHFIKVVGWRSDVVDDCDPYLFHRNAGRWRVSRFALSSFNPAQVLKGKNSANLPQGSSYARTRSFNMHSIFLIAEKTIAMYRQLTFMQKSGLGLFARSNIGIEDTGCVRLHHPESCGRG